MSKIDELKAAYLGSTPGPWFEQDGQIVGDPADHYLICDLAGDAQAAINEQDEINGEFIALAHNLMPALLAAVATLEQVRDYSSPDVEDCAQVRWELANDFFERMLK